MQSFFFLLTHLHALFFLPRLMMIMGTCKGLMLLHVEIWLCLSDQRRLSNAYHGQPCSVQALVLQTACNNITNISTARQACRLVNTDRQYSQFLALRYFV